MENGQLGLLRDLFQVLPYTQCNLEVEEREVKKRLLKYFVINCFFFLLDYVKCTQP